MKEILKIQEGEEFVARVPTRYKVVLIDNEKEMIVLKTIAGHLFHLSFAEFLKQYKKSDEKL